jgi:mannan endo-1,4-beta-mannosidase
MASRITLIILSGVLTCMAFAVAGGEFQPPANPQCSPAAAAVLKYLQSLPARKDRKLVSGQFTEFGTNASTKLPDLIYQKTGCYPALFGEDYTDWHSGEIRFHEPNAAAIAYWRQGGLVTINAHFFNPLRTNSAASGLRDRGVDIAPLLDERSPAHKIWMRELDDIAAGLQELRAAGVVVLWRPFHEMNGGWFWWGRQKPEVFIQVWRQMFDYFTKTKRLDNLLWVYAPNHGGQTADYYPGDAFVDIVGVDAYTDFVDPQHIQGTKELMRLPKPFAFTEFGPHGPAHPPADYNYLRFLEGVKKYYPGTVYFMPWSVGWGLQTNMNVKPMLHDAWMVNRDGLPKFQN